MKPKDEVGVIFAFTVADANELEEYLLHIVVFVLGFWKLKGFIFDE
jgi:hypothetical protein